MMWEIGRNSGSPNLIQCFWVFLYLAAGTYEFVKHWLNQIDRTRCYVFSSRQILLPRRRHQHRRWRESSTIRRFRSDRKNGRRCLIRFRTHCPDTAVRRLARGRPEGNPSHATCHTDDIQPVCGTSILQRIHNPDAQHVYVDQSIQLRMSTMLLVLVELSWHTRNSMEERYCRPQSLDGPIRSYPKTTTAQ